MNLDRRYKRFARIVAMLCVAHSASVTSWIRTHQRNRRVGGTDTSLHLVGLAADLATDLPEARASLALHAGRLGCRAKVYPSHVHVELSERA